MIELGDCLEKLIGLQHQVGRAQLLLLHVLVQDQKQQLDENSSVVERRGLDAQRRCLRLEFGEELLVVGIGDGEVELDLLEELRVSVGNNTHDREQDGHDVQRIRVAIVIPENLLNRVLLRKHLVQTLQQ